MKMSLSRFLARILKPPPVASALALVFREFENTESESAFLLLVLKAPGQSKISRNFYKFYLFDAERSI